MVRESTPRFTKSPSLVLIRLGLTEIQRFKNFKINKEMYGIRTLKLLTYRFFLFFSIMERIRKGMICRKKSGHQLYILLSFDSVHALEIHDVARATSCIACALEMRSSNGRERP